MKTFSFLKHHKLNLLLALALLMVQAYCELTLPSVMSGIVDTGISRGGIESAVPSYITEASLEDVELFLSAGEAERVENVYTAPNDEGVREFAGTSTDRRDIEGFMAEAETMVYLLDRGLPLDAVMGEQGVDTQMQAALGDTIDLAEFKQLALTVGGAASGSGAALAPGAFADMRAELSDQLGDGGEAMVEAQAIEFVKGAYKDAGVDPDDVQTSYLIREGAVMLGYALVAALCAIAAAYNASRTAAKIARGLRHDVYERVLSFSPAEMGEFSEASLITRATNDIQQIQMVLVMCMRMVLFAPCMGFGAVVKVIGFGSTGLQWIIVVGLIVISAAIGVLMALTMPKFRRMQDLVDRNNLVAREIITGIMPIRAFGRSKDEEARYDEANRALTGTYIFTNRAMSFMMPIMLVIMNVISVAIVWFGGHGVDAGAMQVGDLMAYMNYTMQVIMSFMIITMVAVMLPRADIASERVRQVLSTTSSIEDPASSVEGAQHLETAEGERMPWTGELSFNDVSFTYPGSDEPTLEHVSFTVRPGQTLGIIGSTGVGKSTLVQLIPRLYDATKGSVTVDGVDVRRMGLEELRGLIGYVPQKGMLFSGDIASNIAYGAPDLGQEGIERAARIAQASEFVEAKPEGYASPISQGGLNVSGGQRQRLAIARALAVNPKILVFDDSFSALDYKIDSTLRSALAREVTNAAVVIVAQRIATIMHADEILVLDDGRVVGQGTHERLLRSCPEYLEIASSQLSASELGLDSADEGSCGASASNTQEEVR
ncbi:MAG: ABC transporter ATP-binding protein [Coriobacteriaceae bacterium]|nr:ABC transporter ATP-binding protein [Coriobacteriaceae bacterium]